MTLAYLLALAAAAGPVVDEPQVRPAPPPVQDDIVVTGVRTDGSEDYTLPGQTTATRLPLSLRETPQSVSVVTQAQIRDFQLNDVNTLLTTVPGVNVQANETDRVYFSARGFEIQTFQIDGIGVPFAFGIQTGSIDTAFYDHIEVVRGAPGLLSSTGNPSAVVNFIRKRPSRDSQARASVQYGSFDALRVEGDVSVPLTSDGRVRARAVGALTDTDSHLDRYSLRRWVGYGIVEADLGADTLVSAGYGHQDHQSRGAMWGAIPLTFTDGTRIPLARSANVGTDWAGWNIIDRQIFGDVTQRLGGGWIARASAIRRATDENDELFYIYGNPVRGVPSGIAPDPANPDRPFGLRIYPGAFRAQTRNLTLEGYVTGPVTLFGRQHDVNVGINRSAQAYGQQASYDFSLIDNLISLPDALAGNYPRPSFPRPFLTDRANSQDTETRRETIYGLLRLNPADPLHVMLGGNYTSARSTGFSFGRDANFDNRRFLPFVGATLDLTTNISAYASFATIFNPQTALDRTGRILDPIRGDNLEGGVKGAWFGGRMNAAVAVFRARQDNTAEPAGFADGRFFSVPVDATSEGIELDFGGQPLPGVQVTGGYTLMRVSNDAGQPVRRFNPRSTGRLNIVYAPPALPALKLGASAQYQSRIVAPLGTARQDAYALVDLLAAYDVTPRITASVNLRNVTNSFYLTALNFDGGYYGPPRSILGTIAVRY